MKNADSPWPPIHNSCRYRLKHLLGDEAYKIQVSDNLENGPLSSYKIGIFLK